MEVNILKSLFISKGGIENKAAQTALESFFDVDILSNVEAITENQDVTYDFIFLDISFFDLGNSGSCLASRQATFCTLWETFPEAKIVVLTQKNQTKKVLRVIKAGADDYMTLPISSTDLDSLAEKLDDLSIKEARLRYLDGHFWDLKALKGITTSSPNMMEVYKKVKVISGTNVTVLLTGETGVGKNVIAKLIHQHSPRKNKPFVSVHCGAIAETLVESELFGHEKGAFTNALKKKLGKFELANGGTLFLDEIGTVSPSTQIKLLQVLQDSIFQRVGGEEDIKVDIRIIAATNEDLSLLIEKGKFRQDLFFRLNIFSIHIPPLRERLSDINWLTEQFVKKYCRLHVRELYSIRPEVFEAFSNYNWPGNIRELENLTERACLLETTDRLQLKSFPLEITIHAAERIGVSVEKPHSLAEKRLQVIETFEKNFLEELLLKHKGKIKNVAEAAGLGERQIHKLLSKYQISGGEYRIKDSKSKVQDSHII